MPRRLILIGVIVAVLSVLSAQAGARSRPVASAASTTCHSIDGYHELAGPGGGPSFGLIFSCSGPVTQLTFVPGFDTPEGSVISYGANVDVGCGYTTGDQNAGDVNTCDAAASPNGGTASIPANTRIEIDIPSPAPCPGAGVRETLTVDGGSQFTVSGSCTEHKGPAVKSVKSTSHGIREVIDCGADGYDCAGATEMTVGRKTLADAFFSLSEGASKTVSVSLNRYGRSLLAKRHSLKVTVVVSGKQIDRATDSSGSTAVVRRTVLRLSAKR